MRNFSFTIDDKKSNVHHVRGTLTIDGIGIPFTVYRLWRPGYIEGSPYFDSTGTWSRLALRTKRGILKTFADGEAITSNLKDRARAWWIDHQFWR